MSAMRKFRFGVQEHNAASAADWREKARRIESMGYAALYLPDHFSDLPGPIAALMAAADATSALRVGSLVFDNDYRHPVVLAKESATLDLLSDGRLDFGLGAGWMKSDYDKSGIRTTAPACASNAWRKACGSSRAFGRANRFPSRASTTRSKTSRVRRGPCRSRTHRSCSAAAAARCSRWPAARPTSSTSTTTCARVG